MLGKAAMTITLALSAAPSIDISPVTSLWSGAVVGMKPDDVIALFPAAHRPAYPIAIYWADSHLVVLKTIGEESLRDCSARFADTPVCVSFYFDKGQLFGVVLTSTVPPADIPTSDALAERFRRTVAARFVNPPSCDDFNTSIVNGPSFHCTWWAKNLRGQVDFSYGDASPINRKRAKLSASFMAMHPA